MKASKEPTLKAIYSRSLKSAKTLSADTSNADLYSDDSGEGESYTDLLERPDIYAVITAYEPLLSSNGTFVVDMLLTPHLQSALVHPCCFVGGQHVLSEKPVAENLKDAQELISWYHSKVDTEKVTWSVAENYRYLNSFEYAQEQVHQMGRVLGFRVRVYGNVTAGSKYHGKKGFY